jgi:hypothetical protein
MTWTTAPQPARQSRPVPDTMHCEMVSNSSSGSISLRQNDSHAPNNDSVLFPATTKSFAGALCAVICSQSKKSPHPFQSQSMLGSIGLTAVRSHHCPEHPHKTRVDSTAALPPSSPALGT